MIEKFETVEELIIEIVEQTVKYNLEPVVMEVLEDMTFDELLEMVEETELNMNHG